ncbi:PREDICTED: cytochrome P450 6B4-like [Papilio xuthus]|uniref:unspecific monooxygenase n=1 Tax=Papilio xuthus TaxID=66420 RepID=A0AAJ7EH30_PAPXU|nr:PREDICTED: cytochrome P450 6B4-like [Papilio xuthus]
MFFESFLLNLAILAALIVALIFDYVTKFFSYWYIRHVPYKIPIPFFGSDYHRVLKLRSTSEEVRNLYSKYPEANFVGVIKSRIPELIVKNPDVIKKMLSTDFANFHCRGIGLDRSRDVCLRNNLFYAEGEKWTLLREGLECLLNGMHREPDVSLHVCLSGTNEVVNVRELLSEILDAVFKDCLFEGKDDGLVLKDLRQSIQRRTYSEKFKSYLKEIFPSVYTLFGLTTVSGLMTTKSNNVLKESKLLTKIQQTGLTDQINTKNRKATKSENVTELELAYSILSLFITEGYIPCLNVITSLLFELAKSPEIQEKIRTNNSFSVDYLDACIKEALRLYCPYSVITRKCVKAYEIADSKMMLDKKITVTVPVEAIHKDLKHYKNPCAFNPDRFLESENEMRHTFVYLPFGAGPRKCIGEQLAMEIIRKVTKAVLEKYKIETTERTPAQLTFVDHNFMKIIKDDVWLKFTLLKS